MKSYLVWDYLMRNNTDHIINICLKHIWILNVSFLVPFARPSNALSDSPICLPQPRISGSTSRVSKTLKGIEIKSRKNETQRSHVSDAGMANASLQDFKRCSSESRKHEKKAFIVLCLTLLVLLIEPIYRKLFCAEGMKEGTARIVSIRREGGMFCRLLFLFTFFMAWLRFEIWLWLSWWWASVTVHKAYEKHLFSLDF